MGVGAVTVNGVTLTTKADKDAFVVEYQANRLNGILSFRFKDDHLVVGGNALDIREQQEVLVTDDGTRIFGGRVATVVPILDGSTIYYAGSAVSFDTLLDERVIESGVRDASLNRYDDDDVRWIIGFHSELLANTYVSRLRTAVLPTIDYSGKTLRQALSILATYTTGPVLWIDENKQTHWTNPAAAQIVVNPGFDGGSGGSWTLDGSAVVTADAGPGGTGDYALVTTGNASGMHESTQIVTGIVAGKRYLFSAWLWSSVASKAQVRLDWRNSSHVTQRTDTIANDATTSTWKQYPSVWVAPATATEVVVRLGGANNFSGTVRHDGLGLVGETAAYGIDTTPSPPTTYAPYKWSEPRKSVVPVNRVLVRGAGISGWREHPGSIAYYGRKFEGVVEDDRVTTTDGIDSVAATTFRKYAFPSRSGTYTQEHGPLAAGTWQIVNIRPLNRLSIEWIATLKVYWLGNGKMLYQPTYGEAEEDIGAALVALNSGWTGDSVTPGVPDPGINPPGTDSTPPAVVTGFDLSSGYETAVDGTLYPVLVASWTGVGDADLDAYEGQYDAAIQSEVAFAASVSGTGGALPAGTYNVTITGLSVTGETKATTVVDKAVAAGQRLYVNITALAGCSSYKVYASRSGADPPKANGQTTSTTGSNVEITSEGAGADAPTASTAVAFINPYGFRTASTSISLGPVRGGIYYAGRVRAVDDSGNRRTTGGPANDGWSNIDTVQAAPDTTAPAIPTGLATAAGFRLVGVRWSANTEADLATYELRWSPDLAGVPDPDQWDSALSRSTSVIVDGLEPGTTYYFEVRAIDSSGNASGWSNTGGADDPYRTAVPSAIGAADFAADSIIARLITADSITADDIRAGTLALGGQIDTPDYLLVFDSSGNEIGRWDQYGLVVVDPAETTRAVRVKNGAVSFTTAYEGATTPEGAWQGAISADGIDATKITFGSAPGGHNSIPNASFELSAFGALLRKVWTLAADWGTTIGTDVNLDKSTDDLKMSTYTY